MTDAATVGAVLRQALLGAAICGIAHAAAAAQLDLTLSAPWKGWSRPGRTTEIDLHLSADGATPASIEVAAGKLTLRTALDLQPGRVARLQIAVPAAERIEVRAAAPGAAAVQRDLGIAPSESPLLGVALADGEVVELAGFHALALAADDLPRHAPAYASIDALIVDATTLGRLDQRQLAALLTHAARCGRIVVVGAEAPVRRLLDGAGGCGDRALMVAGSPADARVLLERSLAEPLAAPIDAAGIGAPARPAPLLWNRVAMVLAAGLTAIALVVVLASSLPALLATSALATVAVAVWLHAIDPCSQLLVWSEGQAGARVARYQAWQRIQGVARTRVRVAVPPQLADSARPCDATLAMRLDVDPGAQRVSFAEFDTRLFGQARLCYAGSFPTGRAPEVRLRADGGLEVRNAGTSAWPPGRLLARGRAHDLPALSAGAQAVIAPGTGRPIDDDGARVAAARAAADAATALWALDLGGVAGAPAASRGWLAVSTALR